MASEWRKFEEAVDAICKKFDNVIKKAHAGDWKKCEECVNVIYDQHARLHLRLLSANASHKKCKELLAKMQHRIKEFTKKSKWRREP